jgi:hypothetical protein
MWTLSTSVVDSTGHTLKGGAACACPAIGSIVAAVAVHNPMPTRSGTRRHLRLLPGPSLPDTSRGGRRRRPRSGLPFSKLDPKEGSVTLNQAAQFRQGQESMERSVDPPATTAPSDAENGRPDPGSARGKIQGFPPNQQSGGGGSKRLRQAPCEHFAMREGAMPFVVAPAEKKGWRFTAARLWFAGCLSR